MSFCVKNVFMYDLKLLEKCRTLVYIQVHTLYFSNNCGDHMS